MNFILCQIEAVTRIADQAEGKSDRWLLIAVAIILLGFACIAGRWLVGRFEKLSDKHEACMESHAETISDLCHEAHKVNQELAVSINRNTQALEEGSEERRKTREALEKLQQKL